MPVKNLKQKKIELRSKYKKLRMNMTTEQKSALDSALTENFISNSEYKSADTLFAFVSKDIEVETKNIINNAFSQGKKVAVPKCKTKDRLMDFYYINSFDDLVKGAYDIMEPDTSKCKLVEDFSSGICMVPGLVYDREGYRLGFGKGYYDRFLNKFKGVTMGVCYSRCMEDELPRGYYDKPIHLIITEKYTIDTRMF